MVEAAKEGFHPSDELVVFADWREALDACKDADMLLIDQIATLKEPHKIEGYQEFGEAKIAHPVAKDTPLVLISPEADYHLDFVVGWPDFVHANIRRPVSYKIFRRASTWV